MTKHTQLLEVGELRERLGQGMNFRREVGPEHPQLSQAPNGLQPTPRKEFTLFRTSDPTATPSQTEFLGLRCLDSRYHPSPSSRNRSDAESGQAS